MTNNNNNLKFLHEDIFLNTQESSTIDILTALHGSSCSSSSECLINDKNDEELLDLEDKSNAIDINLNPKEFNLSMTIDDFYDPNKFVDEGDHQLKGSKMLHEMWIKRYCNFIKISVSELQNKNFKDINV